MIAQSSFSWSELLRHTELFGIMIPIVAILAMAVIVITKLSMRHRERMAMIERGMHPDHTQEAQPDEQDTTAVR